MNTPLPTFLGVGGQKCASTWLSECLRHHPEVFMASPKEIHFFERPENFSRGLEWYSTHFEGSEGASQVGEFTPNYLTEVEDIEGIRQLLGSIKIITTMRDPAERFLSHYKHLIRSGALPKDEYQDITADKVKRAGEEHPELLNNGSYFAPLRRYMEVFGAENVLPILKDEIDSDPLGVLKRTFTFLEVDPDFVPPDTEKAVSPGIVPRIPALEFMRRRIHRFASNHAPKLIDIVKKWRLPELYRKINADPRAGGGSIPNEAYEYLYGYFEKQNSQLGELIGVEIPWKFEAKN